MVEAVLSPPLAQSSHSICAYFDSKARHGGTLANFYNNDDRIEKEVNTFEEASTLIVLRRGSIVVINN